MQFVVTYFDLYPRVPSPPGAIKKLFPFTFDFRLDKRHASPDNTLCNTNAN